VRKALAEPGVSADSPRAYSPQAACDEEPPTRIIAGGSYQPWNAPSNSFGVLRARRSLVNGEVEIVSGVSCWHSLRSATLTPLH
jgi:hypothetical protein